MRIATALLPLSLAALQLTGCALAKMELPQTLSQEAKPLKVEKDYAFWIFGLRGLDFGGYQVTNYKSGWTDNTSFGIGGYEDSRSKDKFEFKLAAGPGGPQWKGRCSEYASRKKVSKDFLGGTLSTSFNRRATLDCAFAADSTLPTWKLALTLQKGKDWTEGGMLGGELSDGTRKLQVEGNDRFEGATMRNDGPTGFSIVDNGKVVGAVQLVNANIVWLDPAAEKDLGPTLALATSALLLQKNLLKQIEDQD